MNLYGQRNRQKFIILYQHQQKMEGVETVLLRWLSKAINKDDIKLSDLQDSKIFHQLVSELYKGYSIQFISPSQKVQPWQANFMNLKNIYQAIESFYKKVLVSSLPVGLPSVNLMAISKGEDKEGLITLLIIIFIACISEQKFIEQILKLEEAEQAELMNLIQEKKLNGLQIGEQNTQIEVQEIERSKIDQYLFRIQSLAAENESLTNQLISQGQQKHKLRQQIKKLEQETKKIKRELDEKTLYIHQKEQQEEEQESTKRVMSDSNEEVILLLRKQLVEQEQEHLQQKKRTQDKIQTLMQQLNVAQDKIAELESEDLIGVTSNRKVHHQDCVSINEHKNVTQKLQIKLKSLEQKQTELEREALRSKYEYDELSRKFKKQQNEKQNLKQEFEKASKNKSMVSQKDAQNIKLNILVAIRDKLKQKLKTGDEVQ